MANFLVTYDLVGTDVTSENYEKLIRRIKSYESAKEVQRSVWVLKSSTQAADIRDRIKERMHSKDRLWVITLGRGSAWTGNQLCANDWLKSFLTS
jgi:hypothetical protein